jgi:hypothetical protein
MLVVPNRTGLWARAESTPFGHGQPFTSTQLHGLLRANDFTLERTAGALLAPPFDRAVLNKKISPVFEHLAPACKALCGLMVVEAGKRLYAPIKGKPMLASKPAFVWGAVPQGNVRTHV